VPRYKLLAQDALWPLVDVSCGVVWQFITKYVHHKDAQIVEGGVSVSRQE
jgi:hypothetical protein